MADALRVGAVSCGFEHYLRFGKEEGRRAKRAERAAVVDLSKYKALGLNHRIQERVLDYLASVFLRNSDWDFILLTNTETHDELRRLEGPSVSRICLDSVHGDLAEAWSKRPVKVFIAPFGPSENYRHPLYTFTILLDLPRGGLLANENHTIEFERALAVTDVIACMGWVDQDDLISTYSVESHRVCVLNLAEISWSADEETAVKSPCAVAETGYGDVESLEVERGPMAEMVPGLTAQTYLLTDLFIQDVDLNVLKEVLRALAEIKASDDVVVQLAVAVPEGQEALILDVLGDTAGRDHLIFIEQPDKILWDRLARLASMILDCRRRGITPGLLETVSAYSKPLLIDKDKLGFRSGEQIAGRFDRERLDTIGASLSAVWDNVEAAAHASRRLIEEAFPGVAKGKAADPVSTALSVFKEMRPKVGISREVVLGLRDGDKIHGVCEFAFPASSAARTLEMEILVPPEFPEPKAVIKSAVSNGQSTTETVEVGRSVRISTPLPSSECSVKVSIRVITESGKNIKMQSDWPGLRFLSAALVQHSGRGDSTGA